MDIDMEYTLQHLAELTGAVNTDDADWILDTLTAWRLDPQTAYRRMNSQRMWGGAGSIANNGLADNPGMDDWSWEQWVRDFRQQMIDLALHLKTLGRHYPDIDFWLSSFSSWNDAGV